MIAKNFFRDGMIMDLAPDNTQNSLLTNALNATFVTFNGNELSLQNDMGNARVETAMLPEGYIPIGSTELGGIIYIAAYNPFNKKCLLGSFPSPERNLEKEEIAPNNFKAGLDAETFQAIANDKPTGELKTTLHKIDLGMPILHPGDKFYVCADTITELLADKSIWNGTEGYVDIYLATINSENKIVKLELSEKSSGHVIGEVPIKNGNNYDIDSYRKTIQSDYDVYTAKESGKLYIIAELVTIDDFEVATKIEKTQVTWNFKTTSKYNVVPSKIKLEVINPGGLKIGPIYEDYLESIIDSDIYYGTSMSLLPLFSRSGSYTITYTPVMPFGELKNLSTTLTLYYNTVKKTDISEWRYYNTDEYINLRFTINSSETSNNLTLSFYSLNEDFETSPSFIITYNNLFSVSKNYTEIIYLDKDYNTNYFLGILNKNKFYRVSIKLGDTELKLDDGKTTYLYLYTCPIFNGFYESLSYYSEENSLEVKHEEPLYNFNLINSTYGYEENGDKIYPLRFTLKSNFESNIFGLSVTNKLVSGLDKLILPEKPESENSNSVEYKYNLEVKDAYKAYLSLELDWGGMFKIKDSELIIDGGTNVSQNGEILTIITEVTNTATLDYYPDSIFVYKFKPLVYNEFTANQYGITLLQEGDEQEPLVYARSTLSKYPMWYFYSTDNHSNKDFLTASFIPEWETGAATNIINASNIGGATYKYLSMYNMNQVQNSIKNVIENHNLTIVPHLFGFYGGQNTCYEFEVNCLGSKVNTNFIISKKTKTIAYTVNDLGLMLMHTKFYKDDYKILFDDNVLRAANAAFGEDEPRIWSFVMKDEEGKYIPINCFMVQSAISDISSGSSIANCVSIGETSESMMKLVLDMLMSIYKISETTTEILFVGLANDVSLSNNTVDLNLAYSKITMNIPKKQNINNLNYDLPTETNSTYKYIITDSKNDVVDKISEVNTLYKCELDGNIVEVPNIDPNLLYYKIIQTETKIEKLHLMDKNFVWNNSSTLSYNNDDDVILVTSYQISLTNVENKVLSNKVDPSTYENFKNEYTPTQYTNCSQLNSIQKIKISITATGLAGNTPGSFSGTPTLTIYNADKTIIYRKLLDPINEIISINKSRAAELKPVLIPLYQTHEQELNDLDIKFDESGCTIQLSGLTIKNSVNIKVTISYLQTIIPEDLTPNTGIGEYLTLKDGKLCLKSNLTGKDRSIKINAGGPDYITDWKFNSKIQFKNEFAI